MPDSTLPPSSRALSIAKRRILDVLSPMRFSLQRTEVEKGLSRATTTEEVKAALLLADRRDVRIASDLMCGVKYHNIEDTIDTLVEVAVFTAEAEVEKTRAARSGADDAAAGDIPAAGDIQQEGALS